jgi:hypothetical protein
MAYQDKTFCPFYTDCINGKECDRALTPEIRDRAKEATDGMIYIFSNTPDCYEEIT